MTSQRGHTASCAGGFVCSSLSVTVRLDRHRAHLSQQSRRSVVRTRRRIQDLYADQGKWKDKYRINHSNLVMQLFECGFVLGDNSANQERIEVFMRRRFPVAADDD